MRHWLRSCFLVLACALAGCTTPPDGVPFSQTAASLPPVPQGEARMFFYRLLQPYEILSPTTASLNGQPIGVSRMGTVFYRDVAPGTYYVTVRSPGLYRDQFKTVTVAAGQTMYVQIQSLLAWSQLTCGGAESDCQRDTFVVEIADPAVATQQIQSLGLIPG